MNRRAQLRYVPWIARDYFLWGGVATAIIMVFVCLFFLETLIGAGARLDPLHPLSAVPAEYLHRVEGQMLIALSVIGPLIATRGIIASDRTAGYYRLQFARPINGPLYYGAIFVVNGIGFLIVATVLRLLFSILVAPMSPSGFLSAMALIYLFLGGIVFVLSAIWRYDMLSFIAVYIAAAMSWDVLNSPGPKGWLIKAKWLVELLPPVHVQTDLASAIAAGRPFTWLRVSWLAFYGLACFALGLLILKRRQFAKGS